MFVPTCLIVLVWVPILPSIGIKANGSKVPLREDNTVNSTEVELNVLASPENTSHTLPPIECESETCLPLCCPPGMVRLPGRCEPDDSDSVSGWKIMESINKPKVEEDVRNQDYRLITNDPCTADWTRPSIVNIEHVFMNGSIYAPEFDAEHLLDRHQYCVLRDSKRAKFVAKVCYVWVEIDTWETFCMSVAGCIMLIIFVGYSVNPELKTSHGLIFRCFVGTYILGYVGLFGAMLTYELPKNPVFFTIFVSWLNVMNFDMWGSFRRLNIFEIRERTRKNFIWYAIYAWLGPILMVLVINVAAPLIPFTYDDPGVVAFKHWTSVGIVVASSLCNIFLYFATARLLRKFRMDTQPLTDLSNEGDAVSSKKWFKLHMKLLLMTGVHCIVWITWYTWPIIWMTHIFSLQEFLQSILMFYFFLWNDRIKRSVIYQLDVAFHWLESNWLSLTTMIRFRTDTVIFQVFISICRHQRKEIAA